MKGQLNAICAKIKAKSGKNQRNVRFRQEALMCTSCKASVNMCVIVH